MRELERDEEKIINLGVAYREMTETKGWQIFREDIEQEIILCQQELLETILIEDTLGKPKSVKLAATVGAYQRLLQSVDNALENHNKLSNQLLKEQK